MRRFKVGDKIVTRQDGTFKELKPGQVTVVYSLHGQGAEDFLVVTKEPLQYIDGTWSHSANIWYEKRFNPVYSLEELKKDCLK